MENGIESRAMENIDGSLVDVTASQRALELRKFFAPFYPTISPNPVELQEFISLDGALDAFAETVLWRLQGVRAMISLIDRDIQYFLTGAAREVVGDVDDMLIRRDWFGCSTVATPGGLCEHTIAIDATAEEYPYFRVDDLSADRRFASLPVVDGSIAAYRFYAGMPITTIHGVNIGSLFIFDDKPRPEGLTLKQRKFMYQSASNVMRHLETKREAADRRRVSMMSKGIAKFLETSSLVMEGDPDNFEISSAISEKKSGVNTQFSLLQDRPKQNHYDDATEKLSPDLGKTSSEILDKIKMTLDHVANILRESLELTTGGVVLLDTALGQRTASVTNSYFDLQVDESREAEVTPSGISTLSRGGTSPGQLRAFNDQYEPAKILAMSVSEDAQLSEPAHMPNGSTLQSLINRYPKGNIWYIDEEGYFSSIEQVDDLCGEECLSPTEIRGVKSKVDVSKQKAEADFLSKVFEKARQIIFLPLWDAGGNRWYSGCFLWSLSAVPVFTVDPEVAFVSTFTNSMMVEISRLEALTANKMKSDFISNISHEFRSPLHGILASAEFLKDSKLDSMQAEFISTIQNCGSTLLDTINHVLDYSKINSFEKKGRRTGSLSNELYQVSNIAVLCEEIVYGLMAANEFQGMPDSNSPQKSQTLRSNSHRSHVHIILDFEQRDWTYKIQTGALRRIIMNIFGNAQKYTNAGFILVQLRMRGAEIVDGLEATASPKQILVLNITDSGRGMSNEYMERKLYTPFAQEDSFAPGIGLGLSIVWSIVNQLGGMIHIRSELGRGTNVEVTLPLEKGDTSAPLHSQTMSSDVDEPKPAEAQQCLEAVREIASGKKIFIIRRTASQASQEPYEDFGWQCIEKYFTKWFGFEIIKGADHEPPPQVDLVIAEDSSGNLISQLFSGIIASRILLIRAGMSYVQKRRSNLQRHASESIYVPIGPYKLARVVVALFQNQASRPTLLRSSRDLDYLSDTNQLSSRTSIAMYSSATSNILNDPEISSPPMVDTYQVANTTAKWPSQESAKLMKPLGVTLAHNVISDLALVEQQIRHEPQHRSPSPEQKVTDSSNPLTPNPEPSLHILAVDDNLVNLQLLQRYLAKRPHDVIVTATNGVEAVTAVREAESAFDVIFMDLSMPNMDGFEATRLIRLFERSLRHREAADIEEANAYRAGLIEDVTSVEDLCLECRPRSAGAELSRAKSAYIVALTGLASRRDRDEAEDSGFDDFLTKPIGFVKIGELLRKLSVEKKMSKTESNGSVAQEERN